MALVKNESNVRRSWTGEPSIEAASWRIAFAAGECGAVSISGERLLTASGTLLSFGIEPANPIPTPKNRLDA